MPAKLKSERDWYSLLATQSIESVAAKAGFDYNYSVVKEWFREAGGVKECMALCAEYALRGGITEGYFESLNEMHPRALMLLAKYGSEFRSLPIDFAVEPKEGACYGNSLVQMIVFNRMQRKEKSPERMEYIEGAGFSAGGRAVLHAWNIFTRFPGIAYDWTWYATAGWSLYFGIRITQRQHAILRKLAYPIGGFHLLLSREAFPKIESAFTSMLEARHTKEQRKLNSQLVVHDRDF